MLMTEIFAKMGYSFLEVANLKVILAQAILWCCCCLPGSERGGLNSFDQFQAAVRQSSLLTKSRKTSRTAQLPNNHVM